MEYATHVFDHPLSMDDAKVIALLVTSVGGAVVSLIGAIAAAIAMIRTGKIHTLVNSALDTEKMKVAMRDAIILEKNLELEGGSGYGEFVLVLGEWCPGT